MFRQAPQQLAPTIPTMFQMQHQREVEALTDTFKRLPTMPGTLAQAPQNRKQRRAAEAWMRSNYWSFPGKKTANLGQRRYEA